MFSSYFVFLSQNLINFFFACFVRSPLFVLESWTGIRTWNKEQQRHVRWPQSHQPHPNCLLPLSPWSTCHFCLFLCSSVPFLTFLFSLFASTSQPSFNLWFSPFKNPSYLHFIESLWPFPSYLYGSFLPPSAVMTSRHVSKSTTTLTAEPQCHTREARSQK